MINLSNLSPYITEGFSRLNSSSSLIPIIVKDAFDVGGRTTMAYQQYKKIAPDVGLEDAKKKSRHEARERFIEELGTTVSWIYGIPFFRWVYDKTVFNKYAKVDHKIELKLVNAKGHQTLSGNYEHLKQLSEKGLLKDTKLQKALSDLSKIVNKKGYDWYKNLHSGKALFSTAIPFIFITKYLIDINQGLTRLLIVGDDGNKKGKNPVPPALRNSLVQQNFEKNPTFAAFTKQQPAFKGIPRFQEWVNPLLAAQKAQHNPVDGMIILDTGITGTRVVRARNWPERVETAIREGSIIYFFFFGSGHIKKFFEWASNKFLKTPIDLDPKILEGKDFYHPENLSKKSFRDLVIESKTNTALREQLVSLPDDIKQTMERLSRTTRTQQKAKGLLRQSKKALRLKLEKRIDKLELRLEEKVIKFIDQQIKEGFVDGKFTNITLETARKLGLIDVVAGMKNPIKYIDTKEIAQLNKSLCNFIKCTSASQNVEKFFNKAKLIKRGTIIANIATCSLFLAYLTPKIQYFYRKWKTGNDAHPAVLDLEKERDRKLQCQSA